MWVGCQFTEAFYGLSVHTNCYRVDVAKPGVGDIPKVCKSSTGAFLQVLVSTLEYRL